LKIFGRHEELAYLSEKIRAIGDTAYARADKMSNKEFNALLTVWNKKSEDLLKTLAASVAGTNITGEEKIREKVTELYWKVATSLSRPTDSQMDRIKGLQKEIDDATVKADALFKAELTKLNASLAKNKQSEIKILTKEEWDKATKKEIK